MQANQAVHVSHKVNEHDQTSCYMLIDVTNKFSFKFQPRCHSLIKRKTKKKQYTFNGRRCVSFDVVLRSFSTVISCVDACSYHYIKKRLKVFFAYDA